MSVKIKDIISCMESLAPKNLAESWDNVGLMVGDIDQNVSKILFALDCSEAVVDEAIKLDVDMIITHHPMIFKGVKSIGTDTPIGRKIYKAIRNNISIYSAHTNLDIADGGTNSVLSDLIGLKNLENLVELDQNRSIGKCGKLNNSIKFCDFVKDFKSKIGANYIVVNGDMNRIISKVGLCTGKGSSADYMIAAKSKGCDLYITGDIGYHDAQVAEDIDICLIDGTHYLTEVLVVPKLVEYISSHIDDVECIESKINGQTLNIV